MKHLTAAIIILFLIIAGTCLCLKHTNIIANEMISSLNICENAFNSENWLAAKESIKTTIGLWNKNQRFLSFYLHHKELDEINDLLTKVEVIITEKDTKMFRIENKRLMALVEDMRNTDKLTFENLF